MTATAARQARIRRLTLASIRTYERLTLELSSRVTILVGPNGVGKTNLLEACAVVLSGASPRTSSELRLVRDGATAGRISARVSIDGDEHDRDVTIELGRGKQLRIDGNVTRGVEQYASQVPVVTFLPERLLIIRGAPARRRALVDALVARIIPGAATTQASYAKALQQRNALLRRAKGGADVSASLSPWSEQLVELGTAMRADRTALLDLLAAPYAARFEQLTSLTGASFEPQLRGSGDLAADLVEVATAERRRGTTLAGPHLDDLLPRESGRDLRTFGSAGEQRAALLAFTFAARDLLVDRLGIEPVVLLDEPWSELDADRRRRLTAMLAPLAQVVITSTEPPSHLREVLPGAADAAVLAVSSGQIRPWPDTATDSR
ncbi:MAG: recF [Thermoleophilia bacterium]|nr:recF [Thermoleophilia bacterium]